MKLIFGIIIGLFLAIGIAVGAIYMAFGEITNIGDRDRSNDVQQAYNLDDFQEIDVGGVYELDVTVGEAFSVELSGSPEEIARAEVSVEGGELRLGQARPHRSRGFLRDLGLTATITMPSLESISIAGVSEAEVTGVTSEAFSARLSGVGELDISGNCGSLDVRVSGVGEIDAEGLVCAIVDVRVSGIGEANVYASEEVDASVSGIGSINVYGSPSRVERDSSFLADISIK